MPKYAVDFPCDLTVEHHAHCLSFNYFETSVTGSTGNVYRLVYGKVDPRVYGYQRAWTCSCHRFKFKRKCKHTAEAETKRCGWSEQFDAEELTHDRKCPKCNSDTGSMGWAG